MKTQSLVPQLKIKWTLVSIALALLLVAGLFLVSVILPPNGSNSPEHVLYAPAAVASQASLSNGVKGTIASFRALFPEMVTIDLPLIMR
jgi:hypothetical protein